MARGGREGARLRVRDDGAWRRVERRRSLRRGGEEGMLRGGKASGGEQRREAAGDGKAGGVGPRPGWRSWALARQGMMSAGGVRGGTSGGRDGRCEPRVECVIQEW